MKKAALAMLAVLAMMTLTGVLTSAWGQEVTAAIVGTITDPSGAPIKGATVTATDTERGTQWTAQTSDSGAYNLLRLPISTYGVKVTAAGFQTAVEKPFTLVLNQTARVNVQMSVGKVGETVKVSGSAPVLQTEDAQVGTVMDANSIANLSITGRNYIQLTLLQPGVVTTDPSTFALGSTTTQNATGGGGPPTLTGTARKITTSCWTAWTTIRPPTNSSDIRPRPTRLASST